LVDLDFVLDIIGQTKLIKIIVFLRCFGVLNLGCFGKKVVQLGKKNLGGSFASFQSYLELSLESILIKLNFSLNILEARHLITTGVFTINGKVIKKIGYILQPYDILGIKNKNLLNFFQKFLLTKLNDMRCKNSGIKPIPCFIEANFYSLDFLILPILRKNLFYKHKLFDSAFVGQGSKEITRF